MSEEEFYLEDLKSKFRKLQSHGGYDKYYLSYSGGKDSHLLYWFIKEYAPEFSSIEVVGVNTYMEHHEILLRMLKNCDRILIPESKPMEIKEKYGIPCFSKEQDFYIYYYQNSIRKGKEPSKTIMQKITGTYDKGFSGITKKARNYVLGGNAHKITHLCCYELKKKPFHKYEKETGKKAILGIRGGESSLRKQQYKSCFSNNGKFTPLHDLSNELLEKIISKYNIEVPNVYKYVNRTGCMGCPYGSYTHDCEKELALINDRQLKFVTEYFKESYDVLGVNYKQFIEGEENE